VIVQARFGDARFTVLGVPCNQFGGQEPGTPEEIQQFCSATVVHVIMPSSRVPASLLPSCLSLRFAASAPLRPAHGQLLMPRGSDRRERDSPCSS